MRHRVAYLLCLSARRLSRATAHAEAKYHAAQLGRNLNKRFIGWCCHTETQPVASAPTFDPHTGMGSERASIHGCILGHPKNLTTHLKRIERPQHNGFPGQFLVGGWVCARLNAMRVPCPLRLRPRLWKPACRAFHLPGCTHLPQPGSLASKLCLRSTATFRQAT